MEGLGVAIGSRRDVSTEEIVSMAQAWLTVWGTPACGSASLGGATPLHSLP